MKDKFDHIFIPIPDRLDEVIESSMREVRKIHKRRKFKRIGVLGTAAAVIVSIAICAANPALASKLPILGRIFANVERKVVFSGDYSSKAQSTYKTAEDNGLKMTASEIYCDGSSAYISFLIKNSKSFGEVASLYSGAEGPLTHQFLYTEGNWGIGVDGQKKQLMNNHIEGTQVDKNAFEGMIKLDLTSISDKALDSFDLYLSFSKIWADQADGFSMLKIDGQWDFILPITVDRDNTRTIEVNEKIQLAMALKI